MIGQNRVGASFVGTLVLSVMVLMGSAAFAADPMARLATYQNEIKAQATGVYERGDDLYVNVRKKMGSRLQASRDKMLMMQQAREELKKWAVGLTAADRAGAAKPTSGIAESMRILDSINPDWRFAEWNLKVQGQEVWGTDQGFQTLGKIFTKADIVAAIPASYRSPYPPSDIVFKNLRILLSAAQRQAPARLQKDLFENEGVIEQKKELDARIAEYLATAPFAAQVRQNVERASTPQVSVKWEERASDDGTTQEENAAVVTNVLGAVSLVTNAVTRSETGEDVKIFGESRDGSVVETTVIGDVEEVIETKTVVSVSKRLRRRIERSISGEPLFGRLFLSGGEMPNQPVAQTEEGRTIAGAFQSNPESTENKAKLRAALLHNPGDKALWNLYGRMLEGSGDAMAALICYRCSLKLDPQYGYALVNFARVADQLGYDRLSVAHAIFARGISEDPWCVKNTEILLLK